MIFNSDNIEENAQKAIDEISRRIKNLKKLNLIVVGKTGAGKSTLINSVFKEKLAETGIGRPVTPNMKKLEKKGVPLTIYDTRGIELGEKVQAEIKRDVIDVINKGLTSNDINEAIHCILYCVNTAANRIEDAEIEWIRELSKDNQATKVPIIIILTQSFSKKNAQKLRNMILGENLNVKQIIPVLVEDYEIEDLGTVKAYGLDELIQVMGQVLPEELITTLQNVQIASLKEKKRHAQVAIATAVTAATAAGAAPIPFSDCVLLIPVQITMITSITLTFGFDVNKTVIMALLSSTIGAGGATLLGKTVVSNILKLIPGAGNIISGAVASLITAALGGAYIGVMELVFKGEMSMDEVGTDKGKEIISKMFIEQLKKGTTKNPNQNNQ